MAVDQLAREIQEFASYLDGLMRRLDQDGGWCGVFWQRDPEGMRACLDGREVPPWDVVEALLQDLGAEYGDGATVREARRARSLHDASLAAFDARPGGRDALGDRLDVMLREQRYAAERRTGLNRLLGEAATPEDADPVRLDLAWARDDHERATARCVELRHRMENLDRRALRTRASGALGFSGTAGDARRSPDDGERANRTGEAWAEGGWSEGTWGAATDVKDTWGEAAGGEGTWVEATGAEDTWVEATGAEDTGGAATGGTARRGEDTWAEGTWGAATGAAARRGAAAPERAGRRSPFAAPSAPTRPENEGRGPYGPSAPFEGPGPYDPPAASERPGPEAFPGTGVPDASPAPGGPAAAAQAEPGVDGDLFAPGGPAYRDTASAFAGPRPGTGAAAFAPPGPAAGAEVLDSGRAGAGAGAGGDAGGDADAGGGAPVPGRTGTGGEAFVPAGLPGTGGEAFVPAGPGAAGGAPGPGGSGVRGGVSGAVRPGGASFGPAEPGTGAAAFGPGGPGTRPDARGAGRRGSRETVADARAAGGGDAFGSASATSAASPASPASDAGRAAHAVDGRPEDASGAVRPHDGPRTPAARSTAHEPAPAARQRSRRRPRGSARFAGQMEGGAAPVPVPGTPAPSSVPAAPNRRTPRGARFAGAAEERAEPRPEPLDEDARRATAETVRTLLRLRAEGRSGEAHATLVEAAYWPAARFPLLAAELHDAGLDADWATLLWEAASLPADRLVAASDALVAAGRTTDGQQMLRQGVARPAPEIGTAVLGLADEGRPREIRALLDAYVRVRTPEEAARSAENDPARLVPLLLDAARGISDQRHWDLVHALRVAGFTA
ncbi:hypothetical protein [Streptomyces fagopyri]|uniref:hypothetical protein n=1 Tax=Streptomyces fagopyri TaxID=2662397 RepID=UPI00371BE1AE